MKCKNEFCIYQKREECMLNDIELDINGSCTACVLVDISKETLNGLKAEELERITTRYY